MAEEAALTGREVSPSFDVLDSVESTPEMSAVENLIEEEGLGKRSASPPGRQDWRAGERTRDETDANSRNPAGRSRSLSRSRSRSPGPGRRRVSSRERQRRYEIDGSNTTREEPHLQRARLFVGNIEPTKVHRRNLIQLFSEFGEVLGVSVHKGFAFIQMDRERSANKAINHLDNRVYMGSTIRKLVFFFANLTAVYQCLIYSSSFYLLSPTFLLPRQMLSSLKRHARLELDVNSSFTSLL